MKLLKYMADKLYKYSSYYKKQIQVPFFLSPQALDVEIINCEIEVPNGLSAEEVKKTMVSVMAKNIYQFVEIKNNYSNEYYTKYEGKLKVARRRFYEQ